MNSKIGPHIIFFIHFVIVLWNVNLRLHVFSTLLIIIIDDCIHLTAYCNISSVKCVLSKANSLVKSLYPAGYFVTHAHGRFSFRSIIYFLLFLLHNPESRFVASALCRAIKNNYNYNRRLDTAVSEYSRYIIFLRFLVTISKRSGYPVEKLHFAAHGSRLDHVRRQVARVLGVVHLVDDNRQDQVIGRGRGRSPVQSYCRKNERQQCWETGRCSQCVTVSIRKPPVSCHCHTCFRYRFCFAMLWYRDTISM